MFVVEVLRHTPPPVFVLLAYLLWQGVQALRPRTQPLWRVVLAPLAFAASSLVLILTGHIGAVPLAGWIVAVVIAGPLGSRMGPRLTGVNPAGRLSVAGSPLPLVRNLALFASQYAIAVAAALHAAPSETLALARAIVSGLSLGYCAGWLLAWKGEMRRLRSPAASRAVSPAP